jgi:NAD(P)-dependent dehydrogenase (short-subunit alcohol dehydrogenase family)
MSQFAGKVALITGGNAGIGRAAAIELAKQGAKIVVSARRELDVEPIWRSRATQEELDTGRVRQPT